MDSSEVKAVVDRELRPLLGRLGLSHWRVLVSFEPRGCGDDGTVQHGECTRLADYDSALIALNPESFDSQAAVLKTLRHELFHVLLSPFDLYSGAVDRAGTPAAVKEILDRVWDHACEKAVINLERMYRGLTAEGDD